MKIYISGPVRGKVDYAEDFFESEKMLNISACATLTSIVSAQG